MKNKHIVITGGHHNSALVVANYLVQAGHRVTWLGHQFAARGDKHDSAEYIEVQAAGIPFHDLKAGKLGKTTNLKNLIDIPLGFVRALSLLGSLRPDAVLSFGGYLGLTAAYSARLKGIPVFLHEQTVIAGKANKLTARIARRNYLTWEYSAPYFPRHNSVVVGLPLRDSILKPLSVKLFDNSLPTILVLGGKQGSHVINELIFDNLESLLKSYNLIHQTGTSTVTGDYETALSRLDALPATLSSHYQPHGYIGQAEIGSLLSSVDLYLGRSGAHITYELGLLGKRSILVPYLLTHSREQQKNAHILVKHNLATILPESKLSYQALVDQIKRALSEPVSPPLPLPRDGAGHIVRDLLDAIATS